jgi:hypothetical protein
VSRKPIEIIAARNAVVVKWLRVSTGSRNV